MAVQKIQDILKNCDAVTFNVDGTVIVENGIDALAEFCNKLAPVSEITSKAYEGKMEYRESLRTSLEILRPHIDTVKNFIAKRQFTFSTGIEDLIKTLHKQHKAVYLISGGFRCIITSLANKLHVPVENIFSNRLKFYYTGDFAGFDKNAPTSVNGGKATVISELKKMFRYKSIVHIGEGVTDLGTCPPADAFIGYGGNQVREKVMKKAQWFVTDFKEITEVLLKE